METWPHIVNFETFAYNYDKMAFSESHLKTLWSLRNLSGPGYVINSK